jgi:histidine triad (HIT) family protein
MTGDCIFCKIVKGEIKADYIYENKEFVAFMDINPVTKGHCLVIPKKHYRFFVDMPEQEFADANKVVHKLSHALLKATGTDFITVGIEGMDVHHMHIHLIPRIMGDKVVSFNRTKYDEGEMDDYAEKIKSFL